MEDPRIGEILRAARLEAPAGAVLAVSGSDPVLRSRFFAGEVAAIALGLVGTAAARLHELRSGQSQVVAIDTTAAATTLLGFLFQKSAAGFDLARHRNAWTELYPAGDGRWIHLHGGFPQLAAGLGDLLECSDDPEAIGAAVQRWQAAELEEAIAERGLCGAMVRTTREWAAHPQGLALANRPAVTIERIGDAPAEPLASSTRPLGGVRALDLTRVLAGPSCGRTLAEHGADVLRIGAERLPSIEPFVVDTGRGKRNAFLDLTEAADAAQLRALVSDADVFTQGYRPGALARHGFGPEAVAELCPGIVYVSIDCYGADGPWSGRAGWEQLAQSATGIAAAEGGWTRPGDPPPQLIPAAATDYATGALAAFGVLTALARRAEEGGSWHVRASLCQTAMWLTRLGADCDPEAAAGFGDVASRMETCETEWGLLTHLAPVVRMELTPPRWERSPSPLGSHVPEWLPR
ncbi:MAG: CoA transferase [Myxococcales bacterium]|nr:CoA transferase [Myxococcales bacterium]